MINTILMLVYTSVLLLFFAYPAMRISGWLIKRFDIDEKWYKAMVIGITILISIVVAVYLKYG